MSRSACEWKLMKINSLICVRVKINWKLTRFEYRSFGISSRASARAKHPDAARVPAAARCYDLHSGACWVIHNPHEWQADSLIFLTPQSGTQQRNTRQAQSWGNETSEGLQQGKDMQDSKNDFNVQIHVNIYVYIYI